MSMSDDFSHDMDPSLGMSHQDSAGPLNPSDAAPLLDAPSVYLSVIDDGPLVAFGAYHEGTDTIFIETVRANGFQVEAVMSSVLQRLQPTMLLLPTRIVSNPGLMQVLTKPVRTTSDSHARHNASHPSTTPYKIIKSSWLDVTKCRQTVLQLRVKSLLAQADNGLGQGQLPRHNPQPASSQTKASFGVSHYNALASLVDFDSKVLLQAMGSLLLFLQSSVWLVTQPEVNSYYPHPSSAPQDCFVVSHLQLLHLDQYVSMPQSTLDALHIFRTDHHPLALAGGGNKHKSKEGYSLASWMDRTHFSDARVRLKEWMFQPLRRVEAIQRRQDGVELFCLSQFATLAEELAQQARQLKPSVSSILSRLAKNAGCPLDFVRLAHTLESALEVCRILQQVHWKLQQWDSQVQMQWEQRRVVRQEQQQRLEEGHEHKDAADDALEEADEDDDIPPVPHYIAFVESILKNCHVATLQTVHQRIVDTFDVDAMAETLHLEIWPGVNAEFDKHKDEYTGIKQVLQRSAEIIQARFPNLPVIRVVFYPQLGYFVSIEGMQQEPDYHASAVPGSRDIISDLNPDENMRLEWVFYNGTQDFYKTVEMYQLDRDVGDVDIAVKNAEFMIASDVEDAILDCTLEFRETYSALADLDCILSFAEIARQHKLVRPVIVPAEENCILIMSGGHPLQEQASSFDFVRNHTTIDETSRVNIVSGPNYSGKSCYARQVGILTYMAHLGCFLPCAAARMSVVDRILAQFSGVETCMVPQSSFQLDLTNMGGILRTATPHSLVLIDEFGKGTSPASGIALLAAGLQSLSDIGCKVVCTTHFLEIFNVGMLTDGQHGVRALQMAVNFPEDDEEWAVPSFELVNGLSTSSAGLTCARLSGVKASVIARAREIVVAMREGRTIRPLDEILQRNLNLTDADKATINEFITMDLKNASVDTIEKLREAIRRMQK